MSGSYDVRIRRDSWRLQLVQIRQVARRAFDLTRFGNGSAERLCSSLILGAAFFFVTGSIAWFAKLPPVYTVSLAATALVTVMTASSVLVLWKSDTALEDEAEQLHDRLATLRYEAAEERAEQEAEEEERAAEEAARPRPTTKRCEYCREVVLIRAVKCKHCGEILDDELRDERQPKPPQLWNPGTAAVLSFFYPGLGHMYKGEVLGGFGWMFFVMAGYCCCLLPGFFFHVICIFSSASGGR